MSNLVGTWLNNKKEEKQAKHQAKINVIQNDANWEQIMAESSKDSWKDEFWTLVIGGILICSFLPFTQDSVRQGFEFLEKSTPDWFTHIILISVSASYGLRVGKGAFGVLQNKMEKRNAKR